VVALTLLLRRFSPAVCSILIAAWLTAAPAATRHATATHTAADSLSRLSEDLFTAGQYDSLFKVASTFARRAGASGDSLLLGRAITQRGRALVMFGRPGGERDIDTGIRIAESIRDTTGLMPALSFKGFARWAAGKPDEAAHYFERRLMLAQRARSPVDEAWARTSLAMVFHASGDQKRAKQEYEQALALFHAAGAKRFEIEPLIGLGRVASADGDGPLAIRWYKQAWVASRAVGDRMNEMWSLNNLSAMENFQGDMSRSWEYLQRALALARELNSPVAMVVPAFNLCSRLEELGDYETADKVLAQTRTLCETQGATDQIPLLDYEVAVLRMAQGRQEAARSIMRRLVRTGALEAQHRDKVVIDLSESLSADSADAAIELLSGHLKARGASFYGENLPEANLVLGRLYANAGNTPEALVCARRAQAAALPNGQRRAMVAGMFLESKCLRTSGDRAQAAAKYYAALDSLTAVRGGISTPEWREVYGQWVAQDVVEAGRVLLEYPESAAPSVRARSFFDAIQRVKTRALLDRINRPRPGASDAGTRWSDQTATLADLQSVLRPGETLLDFCVGVQTSFLAAVTRDSLRLAELPGPGSGLAERIQLLRTVLASTDTSLRSEYPVERLEAVQRGLGHDILGGVANIVDASSRVFVCADGYFAAVPFGLLIMGNTNGALMQERDVVQVPSAGVLVLERGTHRGEATTGRRVVAISASAAGLTGAHAEVRDLARHYRHVDTLADLSGPDAFEKAAASADVLHIASHALVVDRSPWWSGIELRNTKGSTNAAGVADPKPVTHTRAGFLSDVDSLTIERTFPSDPYVRAWQIANFEVPAKLAVLSACETAGGRMTTGEGTIGLTTAFLSAGVPVVVASMWPVDDRVTAVIMHSFYSHLAAGEPVATALRLAQVEASHSSRYAHPFYWAGFTVVGDGSTSVPIAKRLLPWNPLLFALAGLVLIAAIGLLLHRRRARAFVG